jgi:hypothetical protein
MKPGASQKVRAAVRVHRWIMTSARPNIDNCNAAAILNSAVFPFPRTQAISISSSASRKTRNVRLVVGTINTSVHL